MSAIWSFIVNFDSKNPEHVLVLGLALVGVGLTGLGFWLLASTVVSLFKLGRKIRKPRRNR